MALCSPPRGPQPLIMGQAQEHPRYLVGERVEATERAPGQLKGLRGVVHDTFHASNGVDYCAVEFPDLGDQLYHVSSQHLRKLKPPEPPRLFAADWSYA
jgi:hypothetical protein